MPMWSKAAPKAIRRHVAKTGSPVFTRQAFIAAEMGAIQAETQTRGLTPTQTLGRVLQEFRDAGLVEFLDPGSYRWLGDSPEPKPAAPSKGLFVLPPDQDSVGRPDHYRFRSVWLETAKRMVGEWIVYQASRSRGEGDYVAVARVERIDADRRRGGLMAAQFASGSYLEFGRAVPFRRDGAVLEQGLLSCSDDLII